MKTLTKKQTALLEAGKIKVINDLKQYPEGYCLFDSHHGSYIGKMVQELAKEYGKPGRIIKNGSEIYCDAWDEAENYLQNMIPEGYYIGSNEFSSDFGIWKVEEDL